MSTRLWESYSLFLDHYDHDYVYRCMWKSLNWSSWKWNNFFFLFSFESRWKGKRWDERKFYDMYKCIECWWILSIDFYYFTKFGWLQKYVKNIWIFFFNNTHIFLDIILKLTINEFWVCNWNNCMKRVNLHIINCLKFNLN